MQFAGKSQLSQIIPVFVSCVVIHTMSALSLSTVCPAHHSAAPPTIPSVPSPLVSSPVVGTTATTVEPGGPITHTPARQKLLMEISCE